MHAWSEFNEKNETVSCAGCGDIVGYFTIAHGPASIYCLNCGRQGEDDEE